MKIVADTNILVSALGRSGAPHELIAQAFSNKITLVTSPEAIEEFKEVISRPKFGFTRKEVDDFVDALLQVSEVIIPKVKVNAITRDPSDNKFLEIAISAKANLVVSSDAHLVSLKKYEGIPIVDAKTALERI